VVGVVRGCWAKPARHLRSRISRVGPAPGVAAMSADLQKWEFRDPVQLVMSRQQAAIGRSCAGCAHAKTIETPFGHTLTRCLKGKPYGKKCNRYEVANG